jgi:hypothetical protein
VTYTIDLVLSLQCHFDVSYGYSRLLVNISGCTHCKNVMADLYHIANSAPDPRYSNEIIVSEIPDSSRVVEAKEVGIASFIFC